MRVKVMREKTINFLELYFEALEENIEETQAELKAAGMDLEKTNNKILQMIKQKKAEIKIENGKVLKERVLELIKKSDTIKEPETDEKHYAIAARKLGKLESEDIEAIKKDSNLLKDIGKLIDGDANDTGKTGR